METKNLFSVPPSGQELKARPAFVSTDKLTTPYNTENGQLFKAEMFKFSAVIHGMIFTHFISRFHLIKKDGLGVQTE